MATTSQQKATSLSEFGHLFALAIEKGAASDAIKAMCDMRERLVAAEAKQQFHAAMVQFQQACPVVRKTDTAAFDGRSGKVSYDFLPLADLVIGITPTLAKCGLSYRFDSSMTQNTQTVTCTISHVGGHSESSSFSSPIEGTSTMSNMQKGASALTYARRYALLLALGIGTADKDDDAGGPRDDDRPSSEEVNAVYQSIRDLKQRDGAELQSWMVQQFGFGSFKSMSREQYRQVRQYCDEFKPQ